MGNLKVLRTVCGIAQLSRGREEHALHFRIAGAGTPSAVLDFHVALTLRLRRSCRIGNDPVSSVAAQMRDACVGCVVVTRDDRPIGILTDRDLTVRVLAERRDPSSTLVADVLSYGPFTLNENDEIETAVRTMREHGVRRLPIVNAENKLIGVVTNDDLVVLLGRELAAIAEGIADNNDASETR